MLTKTPFNSYFSTTVTLPRPSRFVYLCLVSTGAFLLFTSPKPEISFLSTAAAETVAHWTFEEGLVGADVPPPSRVDPVQDVSGNGNHLRIPGNPPGPTYLGDTPFPWNPETGEANRLALHFTPGRYLIAADRPVNSHEFAQWTVEASFKAHFSDRGQTILAKAATDNNTSQPFMLRIKGQDGHLELGATNESGTRRTLTSLQPITPDNWYHVAAVATGDSLEFWLKRAGESEWLSQGTVPLEGAAFPGAGSWTIGRRPANEQPAEWFVGLIDEVRITDEALTPDRFLANRRHAAQAREIQPAATWVNRPDESTGDARLALELTLPANNAWDPQTVFLQGSRDLKHWDWIPFEWELDPENNSPSLLRLISDLEAEPAAMPGFLRARVLSDSPRNPAFPGADPGALLVDDTLWIYPTYRSGERRFFAFSSRDLVSWRIHGPVLEYGDIPWIPTGKHAWAPGLAEKDGRYYLYFSAGPKPSYIGVAVAESPAGPFVDSGEPLLFDDGEPGFEAIDAMVFTDPHSGTSYLYAGGSAGATLRVFELNPDMISFAREIEVDTPLHFTEGSFMHYREGIYHFTYSQGYWRDASYRVHHSTARNPTGPWTYQGVILSSDDTHKGPGHHSILYNPAQDEWYIIYHRWNNRAGQGPFEGSRVTAIDRLEYDENGMIKPVVMTDTGVGPVNLSAESGP